MKTEDVKKMLLKYKSVEDLPLIHRNKVVEILKIIYLKGSIRKEELYRQTGISRRYFYGYIHWLVDVGIVVDERRGRCSILELTLKGRNFLEEHERKSTLKPRVLKFLENFNKIACRSPTLEEVSSKVRAAPAEVEPILWESGWTPPRSEDFIRERRVRAKALMVASCIRYGLNFSKLNVEKISDVDVERAVYYLKNEPEWIPKVGVDPDGRCIPVWDAGLIDKRLVESIGFLGGHIAVYSPNDKLYPGFRSDSERARSLRLLEEVKEPREPIGVCEKCGDRVAYEVFKEMKLCPICERRMIKES
jgi:predicted transcriptional regulator